MIYIKLTKGKFAIVDDEDFERLNVFKWWANKTGNKYYATREVMKCYKRTHIKMHRYIIDAPKDKLVDHINGNSLDNRKENLRLCTHKQNTQNCKNRKDKIDSKFKGVCFVSNSNKYRAVISINGKSKHLGTFNTEKEAAKKYNEAALHYYKEFAKLNILGEENE